MDTDGEVAGLPKTEYHKTDETLSAPGKSRHIDCHLVALSNYKLLTIGSRKVLFSNPKSLD